MAGGMDQIKHVVYLMLENRSLDNVLGWLYADTGNRPAYNLPPQNPPVYYGLEENKYFNLDAKGQKHYVTKGTGGWMNVPSYDPYEEYEHVNNQLFESEQTPVYPKAPTMGGFYKDFATHYDSPYQIMQTYTPAELKVINGLARNFAVSDSYYASIPTQTNCNRAFAATGNSIGLNAAKQLEGWVNNHFGSILDPKKLVVTFNQRTIWNVLNQNGCASTADWMVFYNQIWTKYCFTRDMLNQIQDPSLDAHFAPIAKFYQLAQAGQLPKFSFLEPEWGLMWMHIGQNGNDYHPPCNLEPGEKFLANVWKSVTYNKTAWNKTLLIVNFDEHGGTYDHIKPPWKAAVPWGAGTPTPASTEQNFLFDRFGVRVPLILASPYIEASTVFRSTTSTPYDHTSVLATILNHLNIPKQKWLLGNRTLNAPTFEGVLTRTAPRDDVPQFEPAVPTGPGEADPPYNDLQFGIAQRVLMYATRQTPPQAAQAIQAAHAKHFADVKTIGQLSQALASMLQEMETL